MVDYGLARRATLASVFSGRTTVTDVCDAHPYLLRAAKFHGEPTDVTCPICRKIKLTHVTYVYGDELGRYEGRVKQGPELAEMAAEYAEFTGLRRRGLPELCVEPPRVVLRSRDGRAAHPAESASPSRRVAAAELRRFPATVTWEGEGESPYMPGWIGTAR